VKNGSTLHFVVRRGFIVIPGGDRMRNKLKSMTNSQKDSHLLAGENKTLLLGRNAFLFLHALLDAIYLVRGLNVDLDFLAGQGLMER